MKYKKIIFSTIVSFLVLIAVSFVPIYGEVQSLKTDKNSYALGDKIVFFGFAQVNDTESPINLEITGPQGNYIDTFTTTPNTNGSFQIILNTTLPKIQNEFTQSGTYSAIAFMKSRSVIFPIMFNYSTISKPPPRPFTLDSTQLGIQNKSQIPIVQKKVSSQNETILSKSNEKITTANKVNTPLQNNSFMIFKSSNVNNASIESNQQKQSDVNPKSGQVDCNTLPTDQIQKCQQNQIDVQITPNHQKQLEQQLPEANSKQIITNSYDESQIVPVIKGVVSLAAVIAIIMWIITRERKNKINNLKNTPVVKENGPIYGVSYHPRSHDGVRIHASYCRHVVNHSQNNATRWLFIHGYQVAKSEAESLAASQYTYSKNAQCCLNRDINRNLGSAFFLTLFPFGGLLGGLLIKEYYPTWGKGLMYFGLIYGVVVTIWLI